MLSSFNNYNIITLSQKAITSEAFEKIHLVVLYYISKNMAPLFQSGNYGAINKIDTYQRHTLYKMKLHVTGKLVQMVN